MQLPNEDDRRRQAAAGDGIVYAIDDDAAVLRMIEALLTTIGLSVRTFSDAREFLAAYRPMPRACLVCDVRMPGIDGLELQQRLKELAAAPPIIFLTGFAEVGTAVEAMKRGAFDFVEKPFRAQALLGKIQAALELSRGGYAKWKQEQAVAARLALLTPRERGVAAQVVDGKSSREISQALGLSVRTVENHRLRIMQKLHVESTVDLVKTLLK